MLYKGRKAINQEIKSAHWVSLLFIVAQGSTSIYLWTFYLPKQKRKYILWPFKMSKKKKIHMNQVIQQKRSFSWAEAWEKFLLWLLLQRAGWWSKQNPSHHPQQTWGHSTCRAGARSTQLSAASGTEVPGLCVLRQYSTLPASWHCLGYNLFMYFPFHFDWRYIHSYVHCSTIYNSQDMEAA